MGVCQQSQWTTDAQKYFLSTVKPAIIQKYLIMDPLEK